MAKTFTEQCQISDRDWAGDGEGVHSYVPFDYIRYVNNLATYCNNHLQFFHGDSASGTGRLLVGMTGAAREAFICQIPIAVPKWAARLLWTAGVSAEFGSSSITTVTTYITPYPYTGPGSDEGTNLTAFDINNLTHGYKTRPISLAVSVGNYGLAIDATTGMTLPSDQAFQHREAFGTTLVTYLIITITSGASDSTVVLRDFSCWFAPT